MAADRAAGGAPAVQTARGGRGRGDAWRLKALRVWLTGLEREVTVRQLPLKAFFEEGLLQADQEQAVNVASVHDEYCGKSWLL